MRHTIRLATLTTLAGFAFGIGGCSDYRKSEEAQTVREGREPVGSSDTASRFRAEDPTIERFFDSAYGYVVFPEITKGAAGVGAAHGDGGVVYERGVVVGSAEVTQVTIGAQLGGQSYAEIVFFENEAAMRKFKENNLEFSANASAVAASSGAAAQADYSDGVAVFTMPNGGLMFEASIGGQKFKYYPNH
jgi:lipid-binding SYLF domain-containing protein